MNSNRGFSLDQSQFSPQYSSGDSTITSQGMPSSNFQMDSTALYGNPSTILQGLFGGPDHTNHPQQSTSSNNFTYPAATYGNINSNELVPASWSSKVPQFLRTSPPKQQQHQHQQPYNHLHFSNNAPYWNASEATAVKDVRPTFFPSLQPQFSTQTFEEKPKVKIILDPYILVFIYQ